MAFFRLEIGSSKKSCAPKVIGSSRHQLSEIADLLAESLVFGRQGSLRMRSTRELRRPKDLHKVEVMIDNDGDCKLLSQASIF